MISKGPATWTIHVNAALHHTILEIKHAFICVPGTHRISTPRTKNAVLYYEPCGVERPQRHLVPCLFYQLFFRHRIRSTGNFNIITYIKSIFIYKGEVLKYDITSF